MAKSVFQELERFADEIEFVASGSRDIKDVTAYLKSKGIPDSTARGRIDDIKKHKSVLLSFEEPSTVTLNRAELERMVEGICKVLKVEKAAVETTGVVAALSNLKTTSGEKKVQIDALKKESEELMEEISKRDVIISENKNVHFPMLYSSACVSKKDRFSLSRYDGPFIETICE